MKRADVGMLVEYEGRLMKVMAIGNGRTVSLSEVGKPACPSCGEIRRVSLMEHSPLFQEHVHAVPTLQEQL